jgi:hypothetical protein
MTEQAADGWGENGQQAGGRPPANRMAAAALAVSIAALLLGLLPVVGLLTAVLGLVLVRLARKRVSLCRGTGRLPSVIGLVLSIAALVISLGSTALGIGFIYSFHRMSEMNGIDARQLVNAARSSSSGVPGVGARDMNSFAAIARAVREAETDGSTAEARRVSISADVSAFQRKFEQATGRRVTVNMDGLSLRLSSASPLELVSLQQFIKSAASADFSDASMADRMGSTVQSIFTTDAIRIEDAPAKAASPSAP